MVYSNIIFNTSPDTSAYSVISEKPKGDINENNLVAKITTMSDYVEQPNTNISNDQLMDHVDNKINLHSKMINTKIVDLEKTLSMIKTSIFVLIGLLVVIIIAAGLFFFKKN
jgi:hypothetical protein